MSTLQMVTLSPVSRPARNKPFAPCDGRPVTFHAPDRATGVQYALEWFRRYHSAMKQSRINGGKALALTSGPLSGYVVSVRPGRV